MGMINFDTIMLDLDNKPIELVVDGAKTEPTFRYFAQQSLLTNFPDEQGLTGSEKVTRFRLALRIGCKDPVQIKSDEATLIKKVVAKLYGPLIVGRTEDILDPSTE